MSLISAVLMMELYKPVKWNGSQFFFFLLSFLLSLVLNLIFLHLRFTSFFIVELLHNFSSLFCSFSTSWMCFREPWNPPECLTRTASAFLCVYHMRSSLTLTVTLKPALLWAASPVLLFPARCSNTILKTHPGSTFKHPPFFNSSSWEMWTVWPFLP